MNRRLTIEFFLITFLWSAATFQQEITLGEDMDLLL